MKFTRAAFNCLCHTSHSLQERTPLPSCRGGSRTASTAARHVAICLVFAIPVILIPVQPQAGYAQSSSPFSVESLDNGNRASDSPYGHYPSSDSSYGNGDNGSANANTHVTMNFQEVTIPVLARFISQVTNKNFIIDDKVQGKITIISPTPVNADEAYAIFQSVLQVKGYTTVTSGGVIKIVPSREAKQVGLPTLSNGALGPVGDEFITRLIPLHYVAAADLEPVLKPMVSGDGLLIPYPPTNALILTDSASNIRRFMAMLEALDVEGYERATEVIPLSYASASDLAPKIEAIMQNADAGTSTAPRVKAVSNANPAPRLAQPVRIMPDERTNALIVMAGSLELKEIRRLVNQLDVPLPPGSSKINVYPLKHANAEELLPVLADLIGGRSSGGSSSRSAIRAPRQDRGSRRRDRSRFSSERSANNRSPVANASGGGRMAAGVSGSAPEFSNEVMITADPATNSLLISASPQDFATLKSVIDQLDVRRRQVYVEAMILEVSVDRIRELGIETQGGFSIAGQGVGLGRVNLGNLNQVLTDPGSLSGLLLAAASNQTIELPDGSRVPAKIALLRAAQGSRDINVLSAPTLLTTDNEEAEILVGQNVPFVASRATNATELDNLFATVERQDVGITLRLTPQISEGKHVRLDIYEEVSAIVPTSPAVGDPNLVGPTTSVRSATTTVVVKDEQTVVIGGLISDDTIRRRDTVPYLGDIPVLGNFFRNTGDTTSKINLLIFLTPYIVRDDTEIAQHSLRERDRFSGFLDQHKAPSKWKQQLDRPSFALPQNETDKTGKKTGGVLLQAIDG